MEKLHKQFDELQKRYGDPLLDSIYGGGKTDNPEICLVFINPTAKNLASNKTWSGLKAPWIATKQIWKFLTNCGLFDKNLNNQIQAQKAKDWNYTFAQKVYNEVKNKNMYITNLAKCTQSDARYLPNDVYKAYKELFFEEMDIIKPRTIILFGNQISSIILNKNITVSTSRQKKYEIKTNNNTFDAYTVYYPVGNGFFNADKAIEDIKQILKLK